MASDAAQPLFGSAAAAATALSMSASPCIWPMVGSMPSGAAADSNERAKNTPAGLSGF